MAQDFSLAGSELKEPEIVPQEKRSDDTRLGHRGALKQRHPCWYKIPVARADLHEGDSNSLPLPLERRAASRRDDRMKRELPPSARPSVMSGARVRLCSDNPSVAPAVPRVCAFSMQAEQSIVVDPKVLAASTRRTA